MSLLENKESRRGVGKLINAITFRDNYKIEWTKLNAFYILCLVTYVSAFTFKVIVLTALFNIKLEGIRNI